MEAKENRFAAFREFFEGVNQARAANMTPDNLLAIDKTLYPTRGGISFKVYNKNKLAKGSVHRGYIMYTIPYCG